MSALYGVAVLACPVGMGLMMRGRPGASRAGTPKDGGVAGQVTQLRAEIEQLKAERATQAHQTIGDER
jgi:hypothetical protein